VWEHDKHRQNAKTAGPHLTCYTPLIPPNSPLQAHEHGPETIANDRIAAISIHLTTVTVANESTTRKASVNT